jgi:hypothetical protein
MTAYISGTKNNLSKQQKDIPASCFLCAYLILFWDVTPCTVAEVYRRFKEKNSLHLQGPWLSQTGN